MPKDQIVVYGCGGHAKVVVDVLERMGTWQIVGLVDDNSALHGAKLWNYLVLGGQDQLPALRGNGVALFVGIGDNRVRQSIFDQARKDGFRLDKAVHPSAQVSPRARIGKGVLLVAGAIVNPDAELGDNVIVNTGAIIDHDCLVGSHTHISPGVRLSGGVAVGELSHVGLGALVLPNVKVGRACVVGAGAVVTQDVPDGRVVVGSPARVVRAIEERSDQ